MAEHVRRVWKEACGSAARHWGLKWGVCDPIVDVKLIYDSFVWRHVLMKAGVCSNYVRILELMPGPSLTIPLAIFSAAFDCELYSPR